MRKHLRQAEVKRRIVARAHRGLPPLDPSKMRFHISAHGPSKMEPERIFPPEHDFILQKFQSVSEIFPVRLGGEARPGISEEIT
ncbi:MAG: hypothetical protein WBA29_04495 [Xanthobacteraceae bacterium]